jgi:outer membrane receptor protein involved in Fe transport
MYQFLKRVVIVTLPCCLLAATLPAEEKGITEMTLQELLSTKVTVASTKGESVLDTVSSVSVIDRETLDRYNFSTISEAVETVAGYEVTRTYLMKNIPTSRGIVMEHYANKVLVMIDGVPAWNPVTGDGHLDRVSINDVERIEVLKGPASVLYGSNALTGAINIVLKKAPKGKTELDAVMGVGTGREGLGGIGGSYRAGARYSKTNEDSSLYISGNSVSDVYPDYNFTTEDRARVRINEYSKPRDFTMSGTYKGHSILFNSSWIDEDYFGNNISTATGLGKNRVIEGDLLNYAYNFGGNDFLGSREYNVKYSLTYDWERNNTHSDVVGSRLTNEINSDFSIGDYWDLQVSGSQEIRNAKSYNTYLVFENRVTSDNGIKDISINEASAWTQLGFNYNAWNILVGSRYTDNQNAGNNVSSRGTIVYSIDKSNSVKLIAGQSFRAPSVFETSFISPLPLTTFGNPNLKPETSNSVELAYLTGVGRFFVQALGYYANYDNIISRQSSNGVLYNGQVYNGVNVYRNGNAFSARGAELEVKYVMPKTKAFLNLSYIDGSNDDQVAETGGRITYNFKYVPKLDVSLGASQDIGAFFVSAYANYYSDTNGPFTAIGAEWWANATIGYHHGDTTHYLTVRNVSDADIEVPEYVRRTVASGIPRVNSMPLVEGSQIEYTFKVRFF